MVPRPHSEVFVAPLWCSRTWIQGDRLCPRRALPASAKVPDSARRFAQRWGGDAGGAVALNRILFDESEVFRNGSVKLDAEDLRAWHLTNVLKVKVGDTVRAGIIDGPLFDRTVVDAKEDGVVSLSLGIERPSAARPQVDVMLALPRPGVLGRLWPTLAALGVGKIFVVGGTRVEKSYFSAKAMREEEIRSGLIEGLMQAGCDTRLPEVHVERRLTQFLKTGLDNLAGSDGLRLLAHPGPEARRIADIQLRQDRRILVAIGPEGGWIDSEVQMLADYGFQEVSIGPRVLRTETACVALVTLAHDRLIAEPEAEGRE